MSAPLQAQTGALRRVQATVDLSAIEHNARRLRSELAAGGAGDGAALCAVVKANGYGHGAVQAAQAALAGGASWLAVAGSREAVELRQSGLRDVPVLVMGVLSELELEEALAAKADVVVWHPRDVDAVAAAGGGRVHVKLDSGMGRLGTRDPGEAAEVIALAEKTEGVRLAGLMTHFATADEYADDGFFAGQLDSFGRWAAQVKSEHPDVVVHAANSAALLREPSSHFDMVRCGIALYGIDPFGKDPEDHGLRPALTLCSRVAEVKEFEAGQSAGYGRRFVAARDTNLAVLPIGYGDGWRRALSDHGEVLIGGVRRPLVGTVSMDNLTIDLGPEPDARALLGCEAVLIGAQGSERILAEEVANRLGTIGYEVTCALTARVPRIYHGAGTSLPTDGLLATPTAERP